MVRIYGMNRFVSEKSTAVQRIVKILPKTDTQVIKFMNDGKLMSKIVIPGPGNRNSRYIAKLITNYKNEKPYKIMLDFIKRPYKDFSDFPNWMKFRPKV